MSTGLSRHVGEVSLATQSHYIIRRKLWSRTRPLLRVKSRQVVALNFAYDVSDAETGELLGAVHKQGLRSLVRDRFVLLDPSGAEIGYAEEQGAALLRRLFPLLRSGTRCSSPASRSPSSASGSGCSPRSSPSTRARRPSTRGSSSRWRCSR
jgi:hypothetical protein